MLREFFDYSGSHPKGETGENVKRMCLSGKPL